MKVSCPDVSACLAAMRRLMHGYDRPNRRQGVRGDIYMMTHKWVGEDTHHLDKEREGDTAACWWRIVAWSTKGMAKMGSVPQ